MRLTHGIRVHRVMNPEVYPEVGWAPLGYRVEQTQGTRKPPNLSAAKTFQKGTQQASELGRVSSRLQVTHICTTSFWRWVLCVLPESGTA